jgi:hypothetical protein
MKYKTVIICLVLLLTTSLLSMSCATNKANVQNSDYLENFDNQPYFPGCATITSKCNL